MHIGSLNNNPIGASGLISDAWGVQKVSSPFSIFHGMFTFDISPFQWFMYHGATQVYTSTNIVSTNGAGEVTANVSAVATKELAAREVKVAQAEATLEQANAAQQRSADAIAAREAAVTIAEQSLQARVKAFQDKVASLNA